ncbi:oxygen-independent coproporphyrinogen III oxidase [Gluconacetobacter tumulisoli]|uniref:oxygen-independent coproporphyrinogen III oxidase n=1 Tax=Gluconacetobacter tumulisoli TaxID=1286189 RepID=UPI0030846590
MTAAASPDLLSRYGGNLPRYTSYPTAAQFTGHVGPVDADAWLRAVPSGAALSLYLHVPFCDALCLFCGCNTAVMRDPDGRAAYGALLIDELTRVADRLGPGRPVSHVQWGGGTPTTLPADTLRQVMQTVRRLFRVEDGAEIAIELDPRYLPDDYPALLGALGFNRASLGVQDLDPMVQRACGRSQSHAQTADCIRRMRDAGIGSVNVDLIYGLPYQTVDGVGATAASVAALNPDRLAVFGYAHVPWKQRRQVLLPADALPGPADRLAQRARIDAVLRVAGYRAIGLDHYARPADGLARAADAGTLRRNFQGYTVDPATVLVGVGASAISAFAQGLTQNATTAVAYAQMMAGPGRTLPVARGVRRTAGDRLRADVIEALMCNLRADLGEIARRHAARDDCFADAAPALERLAADGFVTLDGQTIRVTEAGRPFLRSVAALFDAYRTPADTTRHAAAI